MYRAHAQTAHTNCHNKNTKLCSTLYTHSKRWHISIYRKNFTVATVRTRWAGRRGVSLVVLLLLLLLVCGVCARCNGICETLRHRRTCVCVLVCASVCMRNTDGDVSERKREWMRTIEENPGSPCTYVFVQVRNGVAEYSESQEEKSISYLFCCVLFVSLYSLYRKKEKPNQPICHTVLQRKIQ